MKVPILLLKMLNQEFIFLKEKDSGNVYFMQTNSESNEIKLIQ